MKKEIPSVMKSNSMKDTWNEKINGILTSYENYTRDICGDSNPSWEAHVQQWDNFQRQIQQKSDGSGFNYCVHYENDEKEGCKQMQGQ